MKFFKNYGQTLFLTALLFVVTPGCSDKNNPANSSGGDIVCQVGEVWIMEGTEGGYIFTADGDMIWVSAMGEGRWYGSKVGTYSADKNKLTTVISGETDTMTYKVSGGKLTLSGKGAAVVFVKRTGLIVNV
jgi:hypothetical protein